MKVFSELRTAGSELVERHGAFERFVDVSNDLVRFSEEKSAHLALLLFPAGTIVAFHEDRFVILKNA